MELKQALATALRKTRQSRGLTQEDFSDVSGRTYVSSLERGLKSPTLDKIVGLAGRIGVHPLSLLAEVFLLADEENDIEELFAKVRNDLSRR